MIFMCSTELWFNNRLFFLSSFLVRQNRTSADSFPFKYSLVGVVSMLQCAGVEQYDFSMTPECVCPTSTASRWL